MSDPARDKMIYLREWAKAKIGPGGSEPPWAWYQYMKLIETLDAILAAQDATRPFQVVVDNEKPILPM